MKAGVDNKSKVEIIMDRREAIRLAFQKAKELSEDVSNQRGIAVLITGKGTDPYIMEGGGKKTPWDDAAVCREELDKLGYTKNA